jgi:hypothetical protein
MTDKEFVLSVYPKSKVYNIPTPKFAVRPSGYLIFTGEEIRMDGREYGYDGLKVSPITDNYCLSGLVTTEELAWSEGAKFLRDVMIKKLES